MNNSVPNWGGLNANEVEPADAYDLLTPGDYPVVIETAEWKETNAKTGHYLKLEMVITDGPAKGRKLWDNLNLVNPNPKAVEIANRTLSAICRAIGVQHVDANSTHLLCGKPMIGKVKIEQDKTGQYDDKNVVKAYKPAGGAAPVPGQTAEASTTQPPPSGQQAAAGGGAPWGGGQ